MATMTGCVLLAGNWQAVSTPPDANVQSIRTISFNLSGDYTATQPQNGQLITSNGRYSWNGLKLRLAPADGEPRTYACVVSWDQRLILKDESQTPPVTVKLRRRD